MSTEHRAQQMITSFRLFWLRVSPRRALIEAWLLALLLFLTISATIPSRDLAPVTLSNIMIIASVSAGIWLALRTRLARALSWQKILTEELITGMVHAVLAALSVFLPLIIPALTGGFADSPVNILGSAIFLTGSGFVFYSIRAALWLMSFWNRLRKRSLMWSLTHAHLIVVVLTAALIGIFGTIYAIQTGSLPRVPQQIPFGLQLVSQVLATIIPIMGVYLFLTVFLLAILLPPSALFSNIFARQTTRRVQKINQASQRFRSGEYSARIPVEGEDEVAQLQIDFNDMAETLEQTLEELRTKEKHVSDLLKSKRELVASVSHELRTPIATLRSCLDSTLDNPKVQTSGNIPNEDIEIMRREMLRLQTLIDDLFTLSRAEAGGLPLEIKPVAVSQLIQERAAALTPLAWQTSRVELISESEPDLPPALADPNRLEQIVVNLLRNAIRYTPPGGIVAVSAHVEDEWICLEVRDTGEGIAESDLPHIWERFFQGSQTKADPTGGAGLGLALVKELTETMGGKVQVESRLGQGSCFSILLKKA